MFGAIHKYFVTYQLPVIFVGSHHIGSDTLATGFGSEVYLGQAEVRDTFSVPKIGLIAGSYVADGKIARNAGVRLLRDGVVVYTGKISSLKRFKDDAREVVKGNECGVGLENFNDVKIGDIIEANVTNRKPDGKLDLTIRAKAYVQMNTDAEEVLRIIDEYGGVLPFNDKASPDIIKREAHMSKNAFKRAVGHLYKERLIEFTDRGIRRI